VTYHRNLLDHSDQLRTRLGPELRRGNSVVFIGEILFGPLGPPFFQQKRGCCARRAPLIAKRQPNATSDTLNVRGWFLNEWSKWSNPDFGNENNDPGRFHAWSKPGPSLVQVVRTLLLLFATKLPGGV
jgi:hypothetical protein